MWKSSKLTRDIRVRQNYQINSHMDIEKILTIDNKHVCFRGLIDWISSIDTVNVKKQREPKPQEKCYTLSLCCINLKDNKLSFDTKTWTWKKCLKKICEENLNIYICYSFTLMSLSEIYWLKPISSATFCWLDTENS